MYVLFLLSKACVGPPWTKISSLEKRDQHLKGTKHANTRASCRCCIMTPTPKKAEDFFFNNKCRLIVWKPSFLWQILYSNENRSLHHLTFDHPQKNAWRWINFYGMSPIQARPINMDEPLSKYLHDLENGSINFIESKTLPTTPLFLAIYHIIFEKSLGGYLVPGTLNIHNSLHPEVTGHTFRSRSKFKPPQLVQGVGFHGNVQRGFSCWDLFIYFAGGNMYEVVVIPRNLT